ncbi:NAD(P)-dependent oxidoreductase [Caulobacter sp. 602-2]|uniref:NAD(P)-dependent oxidoreductase n=1 Tax=Caulobacter sp. 602-2 TaxID=2710887 RepID=A0A6G4QSD5_9CAUL|nr:NAD(P)-dependent oxidoreductase [Caulobacter sp. 602-2]NGM48432.1 NAD(P)-dependent oxidoreductase [Caulobacter sp. 602-2]
MTILVTGGTGLVGSRLLKRMVAAGLPCRAIVRGGKSLPDGVTAIEADLLDPASLKTALDGVSDIIHLAAVLRTPNPDDIWKANVEGTRNLINTAKAYAPGARLIMASTGLVYNQDTPHPAREGDATSPQMPYPASKVAAELELRESGLNWVILRFGFVYGDADGHIQSIPKLVEMFGWHPASRLSMLHHRDIHTAVELAVKGVMDKQVVNLVDEAPMTISEIMQVLGAPMASSSQPLANPFFGHLDGSLSRKLGFAAKVRTTYQAIEERVL